MTLKRLTKQKRGVAALTSSSEFTCAVCKQAFPKAWSDEEARAEYAASFGATFPYDAQVNTVCDNCYQTLRDVYRAVFGRDR